MKYKTNLLTSLVLLSAFVITGASNASADDDYFAASDPVWKEECGSCHIPYPPLLLPASSWQQMMSGLDKHFGTDASVDAKTAQHIAAFLEQNEGRERASRKSSTLRITDTRWFRHEHDEVPNRVWNSPKLKSAANCEACHVDAASGDFNEHRVRMPR